MLAGMAEATDGEVNPWRRFAVCNSHRFATQGGHYVLALKIPSVDKSPVHLSPHKGELYVTVRN